MIMTTEISLRDYFAAKAMSAMELKDDGKRVGDAIGLMEAKWVARAAYRYADAMLAERDMQPTKN